MVDGSVVREEELGQEAGPAPLLVTGESAQQIKQGTVEAFTLSISLWMIRGGASLSYSICPT